jgi:hypothetical protein
MSQKTKPSERNQTQRPQYNVAHLCSILENAKWQGLDIRSVAASMMEKIDVQAREETEVMSMLCISDCSDVTWLYIYQTHQTVRLKERSWLCVSSYNTSTLRDGSRRITSSRPTWDTHQKSASKKKMTSFIVYKTTYLPLKKKFKPGFSIRHYLYKF